MEVYLVLPFLKRKETASPGLIVKTRKPDEMAEGGEPEVNDPSAAVEACARSLLNAINASDVKGIADALYDAWEILEGYEGPESNEPHSFDAQNMKAGESNG